MKRHYIYCLEEKYTKEFYWGVRSCDCDPKKDTYMGSMYVWKPNRNNLIKTIIIEYPTREEANIAEMIVISFYMNKKKFPLNRNYNAGGPGGIFCSLGLKRSEETKRKMSNSQKGHITSEEARKKLSLFNKGKKMSEEFKKKTSIFHKNRKHSELHKKHISESSKGKKMSEEAKKNMSIGQKRRFSMNKESYKTKKVF